MIIGEQPSERRDREAQADDAYRGAKRLSELTGEPIQYIDPFFEYDPKFFAELEGLNRLPKCLMRDDKGKIVLRDNEDEKPAGL